MNRHILSLLIIATLLAAICAAKERKEKVGGSKDRDKERDRVHEEHKEHDDGEDEKHVEDDDDDEEMKHDKHKDHVDDDGKKHDKDKCDEDDEDKDKEHEDRPVRKWKHTFTSKYRRPLDLHIRVPFFTLFLKRDHTGPSKLGLQVFPDHYHHDHDEKSGSLVDIHHRWWKK